MKRSCSRTLPLLLAAALLLSASPTVTAPARANNPPQSKAGGQSLGDWLAQYWAWYYGGAAAQPGSVKNTVFMPLPNGKPTEDDPTVFEGELDVALHTGDRFVLPLFGFVGERYLEADVPDDDPSIIPPGAVSDAHVLLLLDGKTLVDSSVDDMSKYFVDTRYFEQPIVYPEPHEYAENVHAVSGIWFQSLGIVQQPLSKGKHTMELFVYSDAILVGYHNTWHITVGK